MPNLANFNAITGIRLNGWDFTIYVMVNFDSVNLHVSVNRSAQAFDYNIVVF